jgi:hypothetical protein
MPDHYREGKWNFGVVLNILWKVTGAELPALNETSAGRLFRR